MRIIGDIPHAQFKITLLEMNQRVTIQIEDGALQLSYRFRDGSLVTDVASANAFCSESFLNDVSHQFKHMTEAKMKQSQSLLKEIEDEFDHII